jgi:hypothetical protein
MSPLSCIYSHFYSINFYKKNTIIIIVSKVRMDTPGNKFMITNLKRENQLYRNIIHIHCWLGRPLRKEWISRCSYQPKYHFCIPSLISDQNILRKEWISRCSYQPKYQTDRLKETLTKMSSLYSILREFH